MKYNFDEVIDRSSNRSSKYDERVKKFGTADVIPLWVADMDFPVAEPVLEALKKRLEHPFFGYTFPGESVYHLGLHLPPGQLFSGCAGLGSAPQPLEARYCPDELESRRCAGPVRHCQVVQQ